MPCTLQEVTQIELRALLEGGYADDVDAVLQWAMEGHWMQADKDKDGTLTVVELEKMLRMYFDSGIKQLQNVRGVGPKIESIANRMTQQLKHEFGNTSTAHSAIFRLFKKYDASETGTLNAQDLGKLVRQGFGMKSGVSPGLQDGASRLLSLAKPLLSRCPCLARPQSMGLLESLTTPTHRL